jgi:ribosomal protein S18 acetylase RimI-like enzyme
VPAQPAPTVRPAGPDDAPAVAALYSAARVAAVPQMPPAVHTPEEDVAHFSGRLRDPEVRSWVAEAGGEVVGFALSTQHSLDALYVRPGLTGHGIGSLLLDAVEEAHPDGYELWVFESNAGARHLYEKRGFVVVERTDGAGNEEGAPELRMAWRPGRA